MSKYDPFNAEEDLSTFFIDVVIDLPKIETALNHNLPKNLFNSTIKGAEVTAKKAGKISIEISPLILDFKIPLFIKISKNMGLGNVSADGEIEMEFRSNYEVAPNWNISTKTDLKGYKWRVKPVLKAGFIKLPIENVADIAINQMNEKMVQTIDNQIAENFDLEKLVASIWNQMKKPIEASKEFHTWVLLKPSNLNLFPIQKTSDEKVKTQLQLKMSPAVVVSRNGNQLDYEKELPKFSWADKNLKDLTLNINSFISYEEAEQLTKANLLGKTLGNGAAEVQITEVQIFGKGKSLVVIAQLIGSYKGGVIVKGQPKYDSIKENIVLEGLKIEMKTKNLLMKGAGLVFKNKIKDLIQNGVEQQINKSISELKEKAQEQLNAPKLPKGLTLDAKLDNIKIINIDSISEGIKVLINLSGHAKLLIDDLPDK